MLTTVIIPVLALVAVFLFAIQKFTNQVHNVADQSFKYYLNKFTSTPVKGLVLGTAFTSIIQSSTATTVIVVSLVGAGVMSFTNSLGVIFGANIGTAVTSQLVALNLANFAPYIILLGFFFSNFSKKYRKLGKPIFYFGLIFLSLYLINLYVEPVKDNPAIINLFSNIYNIYFAILLGFIFTSIVQSSTVTSGLVVLLASTGLLSLEQSIGIILGANLGTTTTALLASIKLNISAKKVALSHFLFNFLGVIIMLPFYPHFINLVKNFGGSLGQEVASAHMLFNISFAIIFLIFIKPFRKVVDFIIDTESKIFGKHHVVHQK